VREPGVKLAPAGITAAELIAEYCGGMASGYAFKAYLPGGASGGILPASMANIPLDFGTLEPYGCFIGSAAIVVLSDQDDMRRRGQATAAARGRSVRSQPSGDAGQP
jgi:formate dehydrogenase beta subunit